MAPSIAAPDGPTGSAPGRSAGGHHAALDGVRGLAIALILLYHSLLPWLPGGYCGVDVFFVLSGYLITRRLLEERDRTGAIDAAAFYARRGLRLLPALCVVVAGTLVLVSAGAFDSLGAGATRAEVLPSLLFYENLQAMGSGGLHGYLSHTWSLATEEQFYLLWPAILLVALRRRESLGLVAALGMLVGVIALRGMLVLDGYSIALLYWFPRFTGLFAGCALALMARRGLRVPEWSAAVALAVLAVITVVDPGTETCSTLATLATVTLIAAVVAAPRGWASRLLSWRLLTRAGIISYGLYLWNSPVSEAVGHLSGRSYGLFLFVVVTAVTWACATVSWRLVERPVSAWGARRLAGRGAGGRAMAVEPAADAAL